MRFGLRLVQFSGTSEEVLAWAVAAEQAGFDQVWYGQDAFMTDAQAMAVALAERTHNIEVGPMIGPFDSSPAALAVYVATLDELSRGRALLGLGMHGDVQCRWTGNDPSTARERTEETIRVVRALLAGETVTTGGVSSRWTDDCYLRFEPRRQVVPIYVSCHNRELFQLGGAIGDGCLPPLYPPEAASVITPQILAGAQKAGRQSSEIDIAGGIWLSISSERHEANRQLRQFISYFGPQLGTEALSTIGLAPSDFDTIGQLVAAGAHQKAADLVTNQMLGLGLSGTPNEIISRIEMLADLGVTQVNIGGPLGPDPLEAIRLMGEQVIPAFANT